ncbi:MAG: LON peptidase substrate-binding domain-containing protein [bacterium]|nr:LON peptidase substrate-binding domain-containing protein [bacterium]MDE0290377.1 LON peptidase substrate-binding domain-containing protein [bacterium]MDE0437192.1 LON peptidase substrate-binding domain-containing protein [bacterium]
MFPLSRGTFPGALLKVRVFEPRYVEMIELCVRREIGFGVVLIERGSEVGGGDTRFDVGVSVSMTQVALLGNGHLIVIARGNSRIRVDEWLEDAPYPQARVRYLPDLPYDGSGSRLHQRLQHEFQRGLALFSEMGAETRNIDPLPADTLAAAYRAVDLLPVPDLDRQMILESGDPTRRIELAITALESVNELVEARLGSG